MQRFPATQGVSVRGALVLAVALVLGSAACAPALFGAGATIGVAAVQERTVGNALDDTTIQVMINQALLETDSALFAAVGVEVVEGRVLLTGAVRSPEDRVEAVRVAWQVDGVKEVLNEIQISDRTRITAFINDVRISGQLRVRMLWDREIIDINYSIDTVNGVIYLMGIAQDQTELDSIVGYARSISGVMEVVVHVRLKDDPRRS